jgi:hypothetical protein
MTRPDTVLAAFAKYPAPEELQRWYRDTCAGDPEEAASKACADWVQARTAQEHLTAGARMHAALVELLKCVVPAAPDRSEP